MARPKGIPVQAFAIFLLAGLIGALGGVLGAGFQKAVLWLQDLTMGPGDMLAAKVRTNLEPWQIVLLPTAGGLLAGLCLWTIGNKRSPFGIADIVGLVYLRKGLIRVRDSVMQILSSACTIGSGGSIGREGANSQIAATLASVFARAIGSNSRTRAVLLGCGVSAGMACSYNAPIASAIFVMEAVLGNFAMDVFAPVVVASVLATMIRQNLLTEAPIYGALPAQVLDEKLILSAVLLGAICGGGGILFRRSLDLGKRLFGAIPAPLMLRMALGGLVVGIIGLWLPETWGNGFDAIVEIGRFDPSSPDFGAHAVSMLLALVVFKVVATAATAGSGGLGGVFTPNLVVGAALGAFFAYGLQWLWPTVAADAREARYEQITFTLIGMAGLVAATMHTPITAVVLVFELTRHYELTLPVMLCSIVASIVARLFDKDSYYSERMRATGDEVPEGLEELAIKTTYVRDVMRTDPAVVKDTASFEEVMDLLANSRRDMVYVVDGRNVLLGHIQLHDVKNFINDPTLSSVVIAGDLTHPIAATTPDKSLASVMAQFDDPDLTEIAVVSDDAEPRLVGRLTRRDVIASLRDEVLGERKLRARFRRQEGDRSTFIELPPGFEIARIQVPAEWDGRALDSLELHATAGLTPLLLIRQGETGQEERLPPAPGLVLDKTMALIVLGRSEAIEGVRNGPADPGAGQ